MAANSVLQKRTVAGVEMMVFTPTVQMNLFALTYLCDPDWRGKDPEAVCAAVGLPKNAYDRFLSYEPYFSEWLEGRRLALGGRSRKVALDSVGMEQALKGEFQFWKAMAIKEGVISPDKLEIGASIPGDLGAYKGMKDDDLRALENSVLATLRGEGEANPGEIAMVEGPQGWEREGDSGGAAEMQGPLVLDDELGANGERALQELVTF